MPDRIKQVFSGMTSIWKSKIIFRRAVKSVLLGALVAWTVLGGHECRDSPIFGTYKYISPIEAWRGK